ncbi:hypothetical protein [Streptomyces sp. NPDC096068]|uniref:hypothetical protein n=1 Tax=Streptomyces sp. NPDC096068 TaxID=3155424 RepID=UPI003332986B
MEGKPRVHYRVCLPDPDEDRRFCATQPAEPVGTTHRSEGGVVKFVAVFALCALLPGCVLVALFS